jgi:molybdopterin converting factor subunit 1
MRVKLLFFATLRDRAGTKSTEIDLPEGTTVQGLKDRLVQEIPDLKVSLQTVLVAINHEYASDESLVPVNAEVAFFPPVSGG